MIRVESEETQDYVREAKSTECEEEEEDLRTERGSPEEAEEISFVPTAISVPQKPLFW